MSSFVKWWGRLGALLGAVVLSAFVPVAAWASTGTGELVVEAARRRRGFGVFGFLSMLCCLTVVAVVVLLAIRMTRNRRR